MEVNVPGEIEIAVAPLVAQLRVLLVPELMLAGFAEKEVIVGADPVPGGAFAEIFPPQLVRPMQASRAKTSAQRLRPRELDPRQAKLLLQL